eukprot:SAG31_NODE_45875_length_257_cov_0.613924_1_plen_61_part_10
MHDTPDDPCHTYVLLGPVWRFLRGKRRGEEYIAVLERTPDIKGAKAVDLLNLISTGTGSNF